MRLERRYGRYRRAEREIDRKAFICGYFENELILSYETETDVMPVTKCYRLIL